MEKRWGIILLSMTFSTIVLSGCNVDNNELNEQNEQPKDVIYDPTRYNDEDSNLDNNRDPSIIERDPNHPKKLFNMDEKELNRLDPDKELSE